MANLLTVTRLLLILPFLFFVYGSPPQRIPAAIVFVIAALTDALDGYVARSFGQVTEVGKMIDPLIDRFFLIIVAIALYTQFKQPPLFALIILVARDFFLVWGYIYLRSKQIQMSVTLLGKTATGIIMVAFAFIILGLGAGQMLFLVGLLVYIFAAIEYTFHAFKMIS